MKHLPMIGKIAVLLAFFGCFALGAAVYDAAKMREIGAGYTEAANGPATYTLYLARMSGTFGALRAAIMNIAMARNPQELKAAYANLGVIKTRFISFSASAQAAYPPQAGNMQQLTGQAMNFVDQTCANSLSLARAAVVAQTPPADQRAAQNAYLDQCAPAYPKLSQTFIQSATAATAATAQTETNLAALTAQTIKVTFAIVVSGLLLVLVCAVFGMRAWVTKPLYNLSDVMDRLARGELDTEIMGVDRHDEIGAMARAVEVLRNAAIEKLRLEAEVATAQEAALAHWASRAELAEKNRSLLQQTYTDALTGVANRRCFDDTLRSEMLQAVETGQPIGLVLMDIDHFKGYNDFYGHRGGDECLRMVASAVSRQVRSGDVFARYGGEEFAVIMPGAAAEVALPVAERMRACVETMAQPHEGAGHGRVVTISMGVASLHPSSVEDIPRLIEMADKFLYAAKKAGRNCVFYGKQNSRPSPPPQLTYQGAEANAGRRFV
jgi:diguanylate cyclase (GGDEF)-like protein